MKDHSPQTEPLSMASPTDASMAQQVPGHVELATVVGIDEQGRPLVDYPGQQQEPVAALSTIALNHQALGRQVVLSFINGDRRQPVIMGLIHSPLDAILTEHSEQQDPSVEEPVAPEKRAQPDRSGETVDTAHVDGERVVIEGQKEVVLKCGESSITLTRAGKILIRGNYLLNRSNGVNRIMGGSVQVN